MVARNLLPMWVLLLMSACEPRKAVRRKSMIALPKLVELPKLVRNSYRAS